MTACILEQGEPKTGKTGAHAALLDQGYRIILCDFDGNHDSLRLNTKHPENLHVVPFGDELTVDERTGEMIRANKVSAVRRLTRFLAVGNEELGRPSTWGDDTIVILDSGTAMDDAAMALAVKLNPGRDGRAPDGRVVYQVVQDEVSDVIQLIKQLKCHRIVITHLKIIAPRTEERTDSELQKQVKQEIAGLQETKFYPSFSGRQLAMTVARFFSTALLFDVHNGRRVIRTQPVNGYTIGVPVPVKDYLPIETGMATIFDALKGGAA